MEEKHKSGTYQSKQVKVFLKPLIVVLTILLIGIISLIIYICLTANPAKDFAIAANKYYKKNSSLLPNIYGECTKVEINELIANSLISSNRFGKCDRDKTYVKVCKLSNYNYQYTPILSCGTNKDTKFGEYKVGNEKDLVVNSSDIRFTFLPKLKSDKVRNYYPNNKTNDQEVIEYYKEAPSPEYVLSDSTKVNAYKWYTTDSGTNYWNNGEYTSERPDGYDTKGEEGNSVTSFSLEKPEEKDYRLITKTTLYRTSENIIAHAYKYVCTDKKVQGTLTSNTKCEERNSSTFNITMGIYYTCNGTNDVPQNTICNKTDNWSSWTNNECNEQANLKCEKQEGYMYTDKVWKWYLKGDFRKYYPSGNASSKSENTYYVNCPSEGYIKDEQSKEKVSKYFKFTDTVDKNISKNYDIAVLSDKYLIEKEMIKLYNKYNFKVNNLKDLKINNDIIYDIKLEYRDIIKK